MARISNPKSSNRFKIDPQIMTQQVRNDMPNIPRYEALEEKMRDRLMFIAKQT
jgi:hypothetical protein